MQQKNQSFDVKNVTYRYVGLTANVDFDNFIDAATLFDEINSSRIKLTNAKKKKIIIIIKWNLNQNCMIYKYESENQTNRTV